MSPASAVALLRWQFRLAHTLLDAAVDGPTVQPSRRSAASTCYARAVFTEDISINGVLAAATPLAYSVWLGRTGLRPLPVLDAPTNWDAWEQQVYVDLTAVRRYAGAVFAATDTYLATLAPDELDTALKPAAGLLSGLLLTLSTRQAEIRLLRGG